MKSIIIENQKFDFDFGCKMLKLKYRDECPFPEIKDIWDDIQPLTFKEIARLENLEQRRMGIKFLGVEEIIKSVNPVLIDKKTLKKQTTWVNENGDLDSINFNDTYELYKVDGSYFSEGLPSWRTVNDVYYVKCKDTSTDREYFIWVDIRSVADTNDVNRNEVNAIQAIAWTIQTNIEKGGIERIVRQGDCILIKPTAKAKSDSVRHLTEKEYKTLLIAES